MSSSNYGGIPFTADLVSLLIICGGCQTVIRSFAADANEAQIAHVYTNNRHALTQYVDREAGTAKEELNAGWVVDAEGMSNAIREEVERGSGIIHDTLYALPETVWARESFRCPNGCTATPVARDEKLYPAVWRVLSHMHAQRRIHDHDTPTTVALTLDSLLRGYSR